MRRPAFPLGSGWLAGCIGAAWFALAVATHAHALEPVSVAKSSFLNLRQDAAEAAAAGKVLMVMFEQENCSYCLEMRRVNLADPEATDIIRHHFDLVTLDILGDRDVTTFAGATLTEKQYAKSIKVQLTPMTVFFAPDGKELFRMAGYYKPPMFKAALRYVATQRHGSESFGEYVQRIAGAGSAARQKVAPLFAMADDLPAASARAAARGKGLALVFERQQCPECDELHGQTFRHQGLFDMLTRDFDVLRLDSQGSRQVRGVDGVVKKEASIAAGMDIHYTPTIVFFDLAGSEIFRLESYRKPEHLIVVLRYLASGAYKRHASFQDWLRAEKLSAQR
jgi:thioredoxin-related protein